MRRLLLPIPLLLAGCAAAASPPAPDAAAPAFPVLAFFEGRSEGRGRLKIAFKSPRPIHVQSQGRIGKDRTLLLQQVIKEGDKPPRTREWRIRELSPGLFAGTLTDASGPIRAEVRHDLLHISFRMKGGLDADQWLTLAPGGRSAHNIMVVRKFGVTVAALDETISKLD